MYWDKDPDLLIQDFSLITFEVPDIEIIRFPENDLPIGWDNEEWIPEAQAIGDYFSRTGILAVRFPSTVTPLNDLILIFPASSLISVITSTLKDYEIPSRIKSRIEILLG